MFIAYAPRLVERTTLYQRVFALADKAEGRPLPRAMLRQIELHSPKITRKLTTAWFANLVDERHRRCLARGTTHPLWRPRMIESAFARFIEQAQQRWKLREFS